MHTVRNILQRPLLLDCNNWLKKNAEGHERLRVLSSKAKNQEPVRPKTAKVFAVKSRVTSKAQDKFKFPPFVLYKGSHALWNCAVFKEKNATQRAKSVAEQKLCFACLNKMTIIVSGNVVLVELKIARSQSAIAHIMPCSMEDKKYFLGRKTQI